MYIQILPTFRGVWAPLIKLHHFDVYAWASAEKNAGGGKNILEMAILVKAIVR